MSSVDTGKADATDAAEPEDLLWHLWVYGITYKTRCVTMTLYWLLDSRIKNKPTSLTDIGTMEGSLGRHLPVSHNRSVEM